MTRYEYDHLYEKYIAGQCTEVERKLVENYQDTFELSEGEWDKDRMGDPELVRKAIFNDLEDSIRRQRRTRIVRFRIEMVAASLILILFSAALYFRSGKELVVVEKAEVERFGDDIAPGNNKAVLTLADGSQINLDDAQNGLIARESNTIIEKSSDGGINYNAGANPTGAVTRYNSVSTPRGGQFRITLPDGSKVWLNAGSSLRFPTAFSGMERKVELTGEAYFEVAKNALKPFKVLANHSEIKVLGTHFNVMAYDDEKSMNTTLLEGSVQVIKGTRKLLIKPGQAAILNKSTGSMAITATDTDQAVAWKNGYFIFADENIESIMRKVSRWYNVDVSYKGNMNNKDFTGTISRDEKVSELLKMLELTGAIHFKIAPGDASGKGRRITVMP